MLKKVIILRYIIAFSFILTAVACSTSLARERPQNTQNYPIDQDTNPKDSDSSFLSLTLEDLINIQVYVPSKKIETMLEAPGIVSVTPQKEIQLYGDRTLEQLMARQPSVYMHGSYLFPHNIAAFRGDMASHLDMHTLLLINGRPIRNSSLGGDNFPVYMTFPLSHVSRVEVTRGPGSVLFGTNAFTGGLNLSSRNIPETNTFSYSATGGSEGYWSSTLSGGGRIGNIGYVSDFRVSGDQGYEIGMYDSTGTYHTDYDTNKSFSTMNHFKVGNLKLDYFFSHLETFYMGMSPTWGSSDSNQRINTMFGNLGYTVDFNERMCLELNLTLNHREIDLDRELQKRTTINSDDWLSEATLFIEPIDNFNIALGATQENQRKVSGKYDGDNVSDYYNLEPMSLYTQADYSLDEKFKIIGGLQWNKTAYGGNDTVSRAGILYAPFRKWGVKLLRGEAFRAPYAFETGMTDVDYLVGNNNLTPEKLATYDAQIFYNDDKSFYALTYFNTTIESPVIYDISVSPTSFKNGENQHFQGLELEYKHFFTDQWHIQGSFQYQDNTQTSDLEPSTVPHYMLKLGSAYSWDWGSAALFYSFYSDPPCLKSNIDYNPDHEDEHHLSLNIRLDPAHFLSIPKSRTTLIIRGENLFNQDIWRPEHNYGGNPNTLKYSGGARVFVGMEMKM